MTLFINKGGRRRIIWSKLLMITFLIVPGATLATTLSYVAVAPRWNPLALWLGMAAGFSIVMAILVMNAFTPRRRLPYMR